MAQDLTTVGIDIGTSAAKAVLVAADGRVLARASAAYPLMTPRPGWTEQAPENWWTATVAVLRELTARAPHGRIAGVGLSGQMHGSVFLDRTGAPIRPALLWNDARTADACAEIERRVGRERVIAITGNRASTGMQAPKLLWLRANEPEAHARVAKLVLPKDFIRYRLTGTHATDAADASGTLLLDLARRRYSEEMLQALGIRADWLPEVVEGPDVTGHITAEVAAATGLPAGIPVVAGGGDNACAAIGAGLVAEGRGVCSLGTSGTIFVQSATPLVDPEGALNAFCAAVPGAYHLMGVILSAGGSLAWFRDKIVPQDAERLRAAGQDPFTALLEEAAGVAAGADGLLFLPYLAGERAPHMDPHARGAWIGLSLAHERRHLVRALIEGVGFAFADCLRRMRELGLEPSGLGLTGGGGRAELWRTILSAQLETPLDAVTAEEGPALGAAILAQVGAGLHGNLAGAVAVMVPAPTAPTHPDPALAARYAALHGRYRRLYPALRQAGIFDGAD